MKKPVLYSFRRCPYAMRARLAVHASCNSVILREVILRDKPVSMLEASPKGTVPVMIENDGSVIEESLDIMQWSMANAIANSEADQWSKHDALSEMESLIQENDFSFKSALDAYKYPDKFPETNRDNSQAEGAQFIQKLEERLKSQDFLFGDNFSFADAAILPFIRQFAHIDRDWFYGQNWENVISWLDAFKESNRFQSIMPKLKKWEPEDAPVIFGGENLSV